MFDKYSIIIAISCIIGFAIMYVQIQTQNDSLLWLMSIPMALLFLVRWILKRDGFR